MSLIELREVSKLYRVGDQLVHALDQVNLDIEAGQFLAIVGPSGSGKSTLMHIIGCLDTPSSGTVIIDGQTITSASAPQLPAIRRQTIGFVFQSFNLLPKLTVLQNIELPMIYAGVKSKERAERAETVLAAVGLSDRLKHRPNQLSGGQCQRAAIARALVNNPKIILADEPTGNLDSHSGAAVLELLRQLHDEGRTIAIVTHEQDVASVTNRQIEIHDGKITRDESSRSGSTSTPARGPQ